MQADDSFERFVREEYLGEYSGLLRGGFWRTWCCDDAGAELGVQPLRFETLHETWPLLLRALRLPTTSRPAVNASPPLPVTWTPALIDSVGTLCCYDVARFGYRPPQSHQFSSVALATMPNRTD